MRMASEQIFHVGDRALFVSGGFDVEVEVIEERGPLGVGGRHLVRIQWPSDWEEPHELTVPEADLRPITGAV